MDAATIAYFVAKFFFEQREYSRVCRMDFTQQSSARRYIATLSLA